MRILGVNGIHNWSWSNDSFTDRLLARLSLTHDVCDVKFPRMLALFGYFDWAIKRRARVIAEANESSDDCIIAHSFGCLATAYAINYFGAKFDKVIFFAAAAESDIEIKQSFNVLYNIHSKTDATLTLGDILPFHNFGALGQTGYKGELESVINIDASGFGHGDYVHPKNICDWQKVVESMLGAETLKEIIAPANLIDRPAYNANADIKFGRK